MSLLESPRYTATLAVAMRLHHGQVDKNGDPYHFHLQDTARKLVEMFPDAKEVEVDAALIHDVFEDTRTTGALLRGLSISARAQRIALMLTKPKGMAYLDYITRLATDGADTPALKRSVIRVKLADNLSNSCALRAFPGQAEMRARKYDPAWRILLSALSPEERSVCDAWRIAHTAPRGVAA